MEALARAELDELAAHHRLREPRTFEGPHGRTVSLDGRALLSLSSNDYLGLASDARLVAAAVQAVRDDGLGAGASRLISGTRTSHRAAEERLAEWLGYPAALLFSSGYAANLGLLQAFASSEDVVFSDALNHASLIDGCRLSRARVHVYRHLDTDHLAALLRAHRAPHRRAFICSETLFSMDGDEAPLAALRALATEHDASLILDEAHALGVFGPAGRGLAAEAGVSPDVLVGTLGKALGTAGAFVATQRSAVRLLENRARSFVFSTAPPPALARVTTEAVDLCRAGDSLRARLLANARRLRAGLLALGWHVLPGRSPILPILVGDDALAMELSARLLEAGLFVHGIRPPTVPPGTARLRLTVLATHTDDDLDATLAAFRSFTAFRNLAFSNLAFSNLGTAPGPKAPPTR